ncbi:PQ-loop repeat [Dillenia turbinata]|uniref:PQ-loop repeat n=1 Tax=Dillenia turbinata TaxID=194707 RepID=A0AAN8VZR3_9MAGN
MKPLRVSYCSNERKACLEWVETFFGDCLCNLTDEFSFGLGMISLICWAVAEVPQIITNFKTKSGHGVSLWFLFAWIVGDIFNIVGCLIDSATLYTVATTLLTLQCIYYDHICGRRKYRDLEVNLITEDDSKPPKTGGGNLSMPASNVPLEVPRQKYYYTSARSLASSDTPPSYSYIRIARSGPSALERDSEESSSEDEAATRRTSARQPWRIPRSVGYGSFLATSGTLPVQSKALLEASVAISGMKYMQELGSTNVFGEWLGWLMAFIYMGARLPQIWLNIKRGSVEGLNPLMFIFALVANITYVGSILVRSTEWEKIRANLPWLLDAIVCVGLDFFVSFTISSFNISTTSRLPAGESENAWKSTRQTGIRLEVLLKKNKA